MAEAIRGSFRSVTGQELEKRLWPAEGQPKAVVQFVHGMAEHIDRYDAPDGAYLRVIDYKSARQSLRR